MAVIGNPAIFYINHKRKKTGQIKENKAGELAYRVFNFGLEFGLFSRVSEWGFGWKSTSGAGHTVVCLPQTADGFPHIDSRSS